MPLTDKLIDELERDEAVKLALQPREYEAARRVASSPRCPRTRRVPSDSFEGLAQLARTPGDWQDDLKVTYRRRG